ncbi:MAG: UDP-N-acetylmuramoyl-L-alanine--D-glutamate ligase [Mycoplasmatota bacterium]
MFNDKKIFIFGMARSGYEAAKVLATKNCDITINDAKEQKKEHVEELEKLGVKVIIGKDPLELLDDSFDFVIKNPGIRLDHPLLLKAKELNITITNEVEVAYQYLKNVKIVAITGSNGKTTTTTLTYNMLKNAGLNVHLGGNIGLPVCALVKEAEENDILVLEISGHQLHDVIDFKTDISIMTNLSEVHIDHFKTYEFYKENKTKVFKDHNENSIAIINKENEDVLKQTKDIKSKKIYFSSKNEADIYLKDGYIYYNENVVKLDDILLKGNHNYENIMCAIAVAKEFGVENDVIIEYLKNFGGVAHRLEYVNTVNGVKYYNDSKATNVLSTKIALRAFNDPTILILGGLDRGHFFDDLSEDLANTKYILGYGETKQKVMDFANKNNIECQITNNLIETINIAYEKAEKGDVVLLSPSCASWDQYDKFEDRGDEFKNTVNSLEKK